MPSWTAITTLPAQAAAEAMWRAMDELVPAPTGVGIFEIEDGSGRFEVGGYFAEPPDEIALALLAAAHGARPFAVSQLDDTDWVAQVQRELTPVEAGRFFVYGAHDADRLPPDRIGLRIEASMAFGTGHHGSTLGCLLALDALADSEFEPRSVADIGCGSGVLSMAAARLWAAPVTAGDIEPVAIEVAEANARANRLAGRINFCVSAGFDHPRLRDARPYDLVLANILKRPLLDLAPDMGAAVAPDGRAILSGILVRQADEIIAAYASSGFALADRRDVQDWTTLTFRRAR